MEFIPTRDLVVARYATEVTRIEDFANQDVRGWLTINRSARDGRRTPWALRILPDYIDEINSNFPRALIAIEIETYRWQEHKAQLDPGGGIEADARAVQSTRDKIKMDRQEKARKLREDNSKKAAEEAGTRGEAEAQDDLGPRHDAEESDKKRKASDDDDKGEELSPVAARRKRFKIGQKMTANSSL
ncbi:hypothetical protein K4K48_004500 [Colletotrichum sp. SAR 10_66]|nr:hypothetical protein K4K48_004500 [Colletotrichum sp. SAR 10_66]